MLRSYWIVLIGGVFQTALISYIYFSHKRGSNHLSGPKCACKYFGGDISLVAVVAGSTAKQGPTWPTHELLDDRLFDALKKYIISGTNLVLCIVNSPYVTISR